VVLKKAPGSEAIPTSSSHTGQASARAGHSAASANPIHGSHRRARITGKPASRARPHQHDAIPEQLNRPSRARVSVPRRMACQASAKITMAAIACRAWVPTMT
jgi:hypothetical protein